MLDRVGKRDRLDGATVRKGKLSDRLHRQAFMSGGNDDVSVSAGTEAGNGIPATSCEVIRKLQPLACRRGGLLLGGGGIAIVAAVGRKMAYRPGISGKIFAALGEAGINIRMINQGPDELNIIFGVDNRDFADAIRVLYNSFVK